MTVLSYGGKTPVIHKSAWIAEDATIIGNVHIGENSSIWFKTILRADVNAIRVGCFVNIQDLSVVHVGSAPEHLTTIGDYVAIAHHTTIHGCTINNEALIGIGATILNGATVESHSIVAAGALVREGHTVPSGVLFGGVPGKVIRMLSSKEIEMLRVQPEAYWNAAKGYRDAGQL